MNQSEDSARLGFLPELRIETVQPLAKELLLLKELLEVEFDHLQWGP